MATWQLKMASRWLKEARKMAQESSNRSLWRSRTSKNLWFAVGVSLIWLLQFPGFRQLNDGPRGLSDRPNKAQSNFKMNQKASKIASEKALEGHIRAITPQESLKLAHDGVRKGPKTA